MFADFDFLDYLFLGGAVWFLFMAAMSFYAISRGIHVRNYASKARLASASESSHAVKLNDLHNLRADYAKWSMDPAAEQLLIYTKQIHVAREVFEVPLGFKPNRVRTQRPAFLADRVLRNYYVLTSDDSFAENWVPA